MPRFPRCSANRTSIMRIVVTGSLIICNSAHVLRPCCMFYFPIPPVGSCRFQKELCDAFMRPYVTEDRRSNSLIYFIHLDVIRLQANALIFSQNVDAHYTIKACFHEHCPWWKNNVNTITTDHLLSNLICQIWLIARGKSRSGYLVRTMCSS